MHLQPPGEGVDHPGQLADADHPVPRQVGEVHAADDRREVVLAVALEADVAQHDEVVVALDLVKGAAEQRRGLFLDYSEVLAPMAREAGW